MYVVVLLQPWYRATVMMGLFSRERCGLLLDRPDKWKRTAARAEHTVGSLVSL